jgi:tetratricopeptide (TPR) repeat protein
VDVRRFLADEPVAAYREPWPVRAARWGRRHRTAVTSSAAVLLCTVVALATTAALVWRERDRTDEQRRLAEAGWTKADTERERAERSFDSARVVMLEMTNRINEIETGQNNPKITDQLRMRALNQAREAFDGFRADQPDDANLKLQAASLHRFAANLARLMSDYPAAEKAYAASLAIWEELSDHFPDVPEYRNYLAETLRDRSMLEKRMGKLKDAAATLDRAAEIAEGLPETYPESSRDRTAGTNDLERADVAFTRGQFDTAGRYAEQALYRLDALKKAPAKLAKTYDPLLAVMAVNRVALVRREQGKAAEALASHDDAVARMSTLDGPKAGRDVVFWDLEVRRQRAQTLSSVPGRRAEATAEFDRIIQAAEKLVDDYPQVAFYREGLAAAYLRQGELHLVVGKPESAATDLTKSLAASRLLLDRHGVTPAALLVRGETFLALGRALTAVGKKDDAAARWKDAATIFDIAVKRDPDNLQIRRGWEEAQRVAKPSGR